MTNATDAIWDCIFSALAAELELEREREQVEDSLSAEQRDELQAMEAELRGSGGK